MTTYFIPLIRFLKVLVSIFELFELMFRMVLSVEKIIVHEKFVASTKENDIAGQINKLLPSLFYYIFFLNGIVREN